MEFALQAMSDFLNIAFFVFEAIMLMFILDAIWMYRQGRKK